MENTPRFKPGDRIRYKTDPDVVEKVVAVTQEWYILQGDSGEEAEQVKYTDDDRELVPVFPERWINIYPAVNRLVADLSRSDADEGALNDRIGVIHLTADGTVTLHTDV